ncbi:MAG: hypothetical protein AUG02_03405 [Chloroflexi bacterium 13_1_20CM_2_70_9]|nr:MAG: hypothetical protein AUG02_03405 [Chloroflexi bacterium 13_1_20CM_2_70_9]
MRRIVGFAGALFLSLALVPAIALGGDDNGTQQIGPFDSTSTDNGSCSQPWAIDMFQRLFKVHDNGDGTFAVREEFREGRFVTSGPVQGFLEGTVTSATFSPDACTQATCSTLAGFLTTTFGAGGATFTCNTGTGKCTFNFEYNSPDQSLRYHHWTDRGGYTQAQDGTFVYDEVFSGDIANE